MTIDEVRGICRDTCREYGYSLKVPVEVNGRLKRSLGRVKFQIKRGKCYPEKIEFSRDFLEADNEKQIRETIAHEMAHYFVLLDTKKDHGHDRVWKSWAVRLGAKPKATTKWEATGLPAKEVKYIVVCSKCGKIIGRYTRAGKVVKNPAAYRSACCREPVKVLIRKENE